ncbi:MAG: sugar dehydrogenase [Deinococcota bacterium]|nr:sugar dehydrogenase [Deinococcota bacterium]
MTKDSRRHTSSLRLALLSLILVSLTLGLAQTTETTPATILELPEGFTAERVADGLTFPTSVAWDDQGRMWIAEAGGGFQPEQLEPSRLLRIDNSEVVETLELSEHLIPPVVGLTFHDGHFYITHRDMNDMTGAVSRVAMDGSVEQILTGFRDARAEHFMNGIEVGPDGRLYFGVGQAGNSGVMGPDVGPFIMLNPDLHSVPCEDLTLLGHNFMVPDFRVMDEDENGEDEEGPMVLTGAFVPFGEVTQPGQVVPGEEKCGGAVFSFDPADAEGSLERFAWGMRQPIGITWNEAGEMFVGENGYDIRGARPVQDEHDATLRVRQGVWYGFPDFSAAREPLTDPGFDIPEEAKEDAQPPVVRGEDEELGRTLTFVIDHEASGLTPPDQADVVGLHPFNSSPSQLDVAPAEWGDFAGHLFVAEWGDLAPPTNPLREEPVGYRVVRIDPATGELTPFVSNQLPGPASEQDPFGEGMERPFDVKFGPDGAMYIVDYGVVEIDMELEPPYDYIAGTGAVWRVSRGSGQ